MVATMQQAYAANFVWRTPPYNSNNNWSSPLNSCSGSPYSGDYLCAYSDSSGIAKLYIRSFDLQYAPGKIVQARHNVDPPVSNPEMVTTQYRNLYFYSLLHGEYYMKTDQYWTGAEIRYGGWTALKRSADGQWVKDYHFYVYEQRKCPGDCVNQEYTVPDTNVYFVKGYNAGHYSIGSLFDGYAWGILTNEEVQNYGILDAYNVASHGRAMYSDQLSIQWCDGGTCPV